MNIDKTVRGTTNKSIQMWKLLSVQKVVAMIGRETTKTGVRRQWTAQTIARPIPNRSSQAQGWDVDELQVVVVELSRMYDLAKLCCLLQSFCNWNLWKTNKIYKLVILIIFIRINLVFFWLIERWRGIVGIQAIRSCLKQEHQFKKAPPSSWLQSPREVFFWPKYENTLLYLYYYSLPSYLLLNFFCTSQFRTIDIEDRRFQK